MQFGALSRPAVRVPTVFAFHIITVPWKIAVSFGLGCLGGPHEDFVLRVIPLDFV